MTSVDKNDRLAARLRENLRKRKDQARAREKGEEDAAPRRPDPPADAGSET